MSLFYKTVIQITLLLLTLLPAAITGASDRQRETMLFLPLDNRPVCSSYVVKTMEAAGYKVLVPPVRYLASYNRNGSPDELWKWLLKSAPQADAAVISTDSLIYGGLVASRTHREPQTVLEQRLKRLETLKDQFDVKLYAFSTLMRTPRASFGAVEPPYYAKIGPAIFRYSELCDSDDLIGLSLKDSLTKKALETNLPAADLQDWLERRQKNLNINSQLTQMARSNRFHFLAIGKDDNAPLSHTHMEARKLTQETYDLTQRTFQIVPGVDQLGLLLLTRAGNEINRYNPRIYAFYAEGWGPRTLPQYSDMTLGQSVPQQILAIDGRTATNAENADIVLALNTPADGIMMDSTAPSNQFFSSPQNRKYIGQLKQLLDSGSKISLADVAYSNGADNGFMNELAKTEQLQRLSAYNGWNTADNTVGFAICQGVLAPQMQPQEAEKLMRIRIIDDWYYQANARRSATAFLDSKKQKAAVYLLGACEKPVHELTLGICRDLAGRYTITEKTNFDISFPWNRLFEIEVDLKKDKKKS
ncbi:DUF4127 family protein [Phascolarctobacterium faecium]|uniref:DUF4127 family protein n=1 Tax=Phascolarctobacterium faecium TaxID=33025 RepID=UPI0026656EBE|nr:DUF4127 family protein [Phascolarctobacterium faecium]